MNLLKLLATLSLDSKEYEDGVKGASSTISSFGNVFGAVMKTGVAAMTAASGAVALFGKQAIDSYANYEQLEGGVKKLFGDASAEIMEFANNAYKTSGMSANAYLETATSFSAAMIKSLDGNVSEAARITDIAMQAMSDNVNTFGSDMGAVQNAFMGLSRQNYTMLDNLKLGYAGTAQGMLELINDSGVLGKTLTDVSELADVGFANMVLAIQKVQENQNIAGTTAKEAMTTIEGSANATKAAWDNVILAIGKGEGLSEAFSNLTGALFGEKEGEGLLNQIIPRVEAAMEGIGEFIVSASPLIANKVPQLVKAIVPSLVSSAATLVNTFGESLLGLITELYPQMVDSGLRIIDNLASGFVEGVPQFLSNALPMVLSFAETLREDAGSFVDAGINFIINLMQGLMDGLPTLIEYVPQIITNIMGIINDNAPKLLGAGLQLIVMLAQGIWNALPSVLANIGNIIQAIVSIISAFNWLDLGSKIISGIVNGLKAIGANIPSTLKGFITDAVNAVKNIDWVALGKSIIDGIISGIKAIGSGIGNILTGIVSGGMEMVRGAFKINSPSKVFRDEVGKWIPLGIAEGIRDNEGAVADAMQDIPTIAINGYDGEYSQTRSYGYPRSDLNEVVSLLREIADKGMSVTLVGDTNGLFKVVKEKDRKYRTSTGRSAFSY